MIDATRKPLRGFTKKPLLKDVLQEQGYLNLRQTQEYLGLSKDKVQRLLALHNLEFYIVAKVYMIPETSIRKLSRLVHKTPGE